MDISRLKGRTSTSRLRCLLSAVVVLATSGAFVVTGALPAYAAGPVCPTLRAGAWNWSGTASSGLSTGPWAANLDFGGGLTGTMTMLAGIPTDLPITGNVSCDQIEMGDVSAAISFSGTIAPDGYTMSGTWQLPGGSGTYKGWFQAGGLDVSGYCQSLGFNGQGATPPATLLKGTTVGPDFAFDNWACVGTGGTVPIASSGPAPSMNDACVAQSPGFTTYAHPTSPDDAYSWNCYPISLVTSITGSPATVTAGSDVQYGITVQNNGLEPVAGVQVADTLPTGATLVSASGPGPCNGATTVTCAIGTVAPSGSASVTLLVKTGSVVPAGGVATDTATATPGSNNVASLDTAIVAPTSGSASGYVPPGGSIGTGGSNPALLTLPNSGNGAPVSLMQAPGASFCNGVCTGPGTYISNFPGYSDPTQPIKLDLSFQDPNPFAALRDYATSTIYKHFDYDPPTVGHAVPDCADNPAWTRAQKRAAAIRRAWRIGTQSGIANPAPCVNRRSITRLTSNRSGPYLVTFEILFLSDDGGFSRR